MGFSIHFKSTFCCVKRVCFSSVAAVAPRPTFVVVVVVVVVVVANPRCWCLSKASEISTSWKAPSYFQSPSWNFDFESFSELIFG